VRTVVIEAAAAKDFAFAREGSPCVQDSHDLFIRVIFQESVDFSD